MAELRTYKDVKIAVYAICKNESKFIDGWLKNMWCNGNGADGVYILDTGSDDDSLKLFENISKNMGVPEGWLVVSQKKYDVWRFDVARNDNMDMVPTNQYDVFYCIDLDELVIPDFWDDLRKMVFQHPNFEYIYYKYAWSHDKQTNEPKCCFWYCKIHGTKGWRWEFPVHETLVCKDRTKYGYEGKYYLDSKKIYLHHYPDDTKSRGSYLKLLELRAAENPDDLYGLYYLSREYGFHNQHENALKIELCLYSRLLKDNPTQQELAVRDDMCMLPALCCLIGDSFVKIGIKDDAEYYYRKAIKHTPTFRDGYIKLAQLLAYCDRPYDCYQVLGEMYSKTKKINDWRIVDYYWRKWKVYQIIADAKCWEKEYNVAAEYFKLAEQDIKTDTDINEAIREGFYSDYQWLKNHNPELFQTK